MGSSAAMAVAAPVVQPPKINHPPYTVMLTVTAPLPFHELTLAGSASTSSLRIECPSRWGSVTRARLAAQGYCLAKYCPHCCRHRASTRKSWRWHAHASAPCRESLGQTGPAARNAWNDSHHPPPQIVLLRRLSLLFCCIPPLSPTKLPLPATAPPSPFPSIGASICCYLSAC